MSANSWVRSFLFFTFFSLSHSTQANESWSRILFPMAKINSYGDYVMAYTNKIVVRWENTYFGQPINTRAYFPKLFSGGISRDRNHPFALICAGRTIWKFEIESGRGVYTKDKLDPGMNVRCALLPDGTAGIFDATSKRMRLVDGSFSAPFPISGDQIRFAAVGNSFMAMDDTGRGVFTNSQGEILSVQKIIPGFESHWTIEGGDHGFLAADNFGTYEVRVDSQLSTVSQQLPPSPCEEKQICGLSYAPDGSWFIVGYWGAYHGKGRIHSRVPVHNLPGEFAGVGAAHTKEGGQFIFFGIDNGDMGTLPALPESAPVTLSSLSNSKSFVWTAQKPQDPAYQFLGEVQVSGDRKQYLSAVAQTDAKARMSSDLKWISSEDEISISLPLEAQSQPSPKNIWWSEDLRLEDARDFAKEAGLKAADIRVAVIDTGFDFQHPFQSQRFWINPEEIPENGIDDDGNGLVDDLYGYDFVHEDPVPDDENGHGTHVSGLIAGWNSQTGEQFGVAPNAQLLIAKVFNRKGQSNSIDLARAVVYAASSSAKVVNCSWGGGAKSQGLDDAFQILAQTGALVISSAGNQSLNLDKYPQVPVIYPGVVGIGATTRRGRLAEYSNFGKETVKILFPGSNIWSTVPGGGFHEMSGTSMSAAIASGSAAWFLGLQKGRSQGMDDPQMNMMDVFCEGAKPGKVKHSLCGRADLMGAMEVFTRLY